MLIADKSREDSVPPPSSRSGSAVVRRDALPGTCAPDTHVAVFEKMLDPDPDRRASRLSQIISRVEVPRVDTRRPRTGTRTESRSDDPHQVGMNEFFRSATQHSNRRARKRAERDARREERAARRTQRFERGRYAQGPPWPISFFLSLGISLGILFVVMATQVVVPLLLVLLSVIFARQPLQRAAHRVRLAGRDAIENMNRSRRWLSGDIPFPDEAEERQPIRVDAEAQRVRVDDVETPHAQFDEEEDERVEEDGPSKRSSNER